MNDVAYNEWFARLTLHPRPRSWQGDLAHESFCRSRLIRIPTGMGKTEGVLTAWAFHRICRADDNWPRRLVWCLPMRVLVEQTAEVANQVALRIPEVQRPFVHIAMGGEDLTEWFLYPEVPAIVIGTQDMLLSRALNRGYASGRARWPVEFGLLNQDALWVMDEVQLMDVGLATSAQLQAFRGEDGRKGLRPCHSWWMSATLQADWLRSVDTVQHHAEWINDPCEVAASERTGGLWDIPKGLTVDSNGPDDHPAFARHVLERHAALPDGEYGRITLVVCNTVDRACETFDALHQAGRRDGLELVHGRYRPAERETWRDRFLSRAACVKGVDRIIVATQVVEAGVDISAGCLVTELAPWSSLVQRIGRCARYGGMGNVLVIERGRDEAISAPYRPEELESALDALQKLNDAGIKALESHENSLGPEDRARLYPFAPAHLLLRREFDELFDTTPDLTGADLDISRFIRSGEERDLQVFWIDVEKEKKGEKPKKPSADYRPQRKELCAVPFLKARDWLCEPKKSRLKPGHRAWVWDWLDGDWTPVTRESLLPGRVVCVASDTGGYRIDRGFDPKSRDVVPRPQLEEVSQATQALDEADNQQGGEPMSFNPWKTIACHTIEVASETREIAKRLGTPKDIQETLELAAFWHDWGKSHPAFQGSIRDSDEIKRLARKDLAKAPYECWPKKHRYEYLDGSEKRPAFRHELASALGLFAILRTYAPQHPALLGPWSELVAMLGRSAVSRQPLPPAPPPLIRRILDLKPEGFDLLVYLVASHHGKVRVALHAAPKDQEYRDTDGHGLPIRGVREGDRLPAVELIPGEPAFPEVTLTLSPATIGLSEKTGISWRERCLGVIERFGPAGLAYLEAILRAADVRASRLRTSDPALVSEANP